MMRTESKVIKDKSKTNSRRAIAFREYLNEEESQAVSDLVSACNSFDDTSYSAPLDADLYYLMYERSKSESTSDSNSFDDTSHSAALAGFIAVWHMGSTREGESLDELSVFTLPKFRRQHVFLELFKNAAPKLAPNLQFSVYRNELSDSFLPYLGALYESDEYMMEKTLCKASDDTDEGVTFTDAALKLIKEEDGGFLELSFGEVGFKLFSDGKRAYIYGVLVYDSFRGRGLGRQLMLYLFRELRALGAESVFLQVFSENMPAVRLYEELGFNITEKLSYAFSNVSEYGKIISHD